MEKLLLGSGEGAVQLYDQPAAVMFFQNAGGTDILEGHLDAFVVKTEIEDLGPPSHLPGVMDANGLRLGFDDFAIMVSPSLTEGLAHFIPADDFLGGDTKSSDEVGGDVLGIEVEILGDECLVDFIEDVPDIVSFIARLESMAPGQEEAESQQESGDGKLSHGI